MKKKFISRRFIRNFLFLLLGSLLFQSISAFAQEIGPIEPLFPDKIEPHLNTSINYLNDALQTSDSHNYLVEPDYLELISTCISLKGEPCNDKAMSDIHYKLMKNLETPKSTEKLEKVNENPVTISDKGISYLSNSLSNYSLSKSLNSTNISQQYYVTQIALWLYIYENKSNFSSTFCANGACDFTTTAGGSTLVSSQDIRSYITRASNVPNYEYLKNILTLVDNANAYKGVSDTPGLVIDQSKKFNYTIDADYKNITTDIITPTYSAISFIDYGIEIEDPNHYGAYITDEDGNRIGITNLRNGFRIVIPLKEDITTMNLSSIKVTIYGRFFRDGAYSYKVTSTSNGNMLINKKQRFSDVLIDSHKYYITGTAIKLYNFIKISKINATNGKELPGATLKIYKDGSDEVVEQWISTNKAHYVHLDNGKYRMCETQAPEGFALNTECVSFTVDDSKVMSVEMKNEPVVPTDNTGLFKNKNVLYIGCGFILLGLIGIFLSLRMKKTSN